jgi:serine/threonine protein kinase
VRRALLVDLIEWGGKSQEQKVWLAILRRIGYLPLIVAGPEDPRKEPTEGAPSSGAATLALDSADALAATQAAAEIAAGSQSLVGATIAGRYKVEKRLGEGGMGTVYQALHMVLEKPVALKVLHPELARKKELVERFLQEAKAASRIRHENVIDISDFGVADGHVYFAMELLHGHDLHEEIMTVRKAGKLLPWARTKNIFLQICNALSVAHERGIVHRDLKPENVYLVEFRGDPDFVKLLDFGIAKMTEVSDSQEGRKLTKTGMLFGTPDYMAPEQARGEKADHRVDIYAMGCLLFLLVANQLPFQAENFMALLTKHLTEEPPEIAPETFDQIGAPRELAEVIDRALEKDREHRWQTIDELATAIQEVCGEVPQQHARRKRAPSVNAPEQTTRTRTPTDQARSKTPSGSQRMKPPTGDQRPRPPTGPPPLPRNKPLTGPPTLPPELIDAELISDAELIPEASWAGSTSERAARVKKVSDAELIPEASWAGSTSELAARVKKVSAASRTPETSWVGSAAEVERRASVIELGRPPEPQQKGHVFAIVSAIAVLGVIAGAAYALGWFGGGEKREHPPIATAGSNVPAAAPGAQVVAPPEPLPPTEVVIDSVPPGATIIALPDQTTIGKTPYTLTVERNAEPRHFKLVLAGYADTTVDVVADQPKVELKPRLSRALPGAANTDVQKPKTTQVTKPETSTAVTKPDTSSAVTKPDTSSAVTKPDTSETKPEKPPQPANDGDAPKPPEPAKPPEQPKPAPESPNPTP